MMKKLKILILCGGISSEHEVSLRSAQMVFKHLNRRKYTPTLVVIQKNGRWRFGKGNPPTSLGDALNRIKKLNFDSIFIAMHGAFGEDGRIQALLELIGLPYTGSGVVSSAISMNKDITNTLYTIHGLRVPLYSIVNYGGRDMKINLDFPVVVKPVNGGSSVGVSIVTKKRDFKLALSKAFKEGPTVVVQKYIQGREFTCGVLEGKDGKPFALPPTEIIPQLSHFFDYEAKYKIGASLEITPARLSPSMIEKIQAMAVKAHRILGCRGMSRSDFILSGSTFFILETNTIPGITNGSLLPQAARAANISFPMLLDMIIIASLRRKSS